MWATGFDFGTGAMLRMGIRGRDGVTLEDHWADGPTTFLGVQTFGFPNLFFPGGPHPTIPGSRSGGAVSRKRLRSDGSRTRSIYASLDAKG